MATFIKTERGVINLETITRATRPAEVSRENVGRVLECDLYTMDGQRVTLRGQEAQDVYDYLEYICIGIDWAKARQTVKK